jgi:hypothetical protein
VREVDAAAAGEVGVESGWERRLKRRGFFLSPPPFPSSCPGEEAEKYLEGLFPLASVTGGPWAGRLTGGHTCQLGTTA